MDLCFLFPAEIDDMSICYVLRDGDNATSDIFNFSIEDSGESLDLNMSLTRMRSPVMLFLKAEVCDTISRFI